MAAMRSMMAKLKSEAVNSSKKDASVYVCRKDAFTFLGYTFARYYSPPDGWVLFGAASRSEENPEAVPCEIGKGDGSTHTYVHEDRGEKLGSLNQRVAGLGQLLLSGDRSQGLRDRCNSYGTS